MKKKTIKGAPTLIPNLFYFSFRTNSFEPFIEDGRNQTLRKFVNWQKLTTNR